MHTPIFLFFSAFQKASQIITQNKTEKERKQKVIETKTKPKNVETTCTIKSGIIYIRAINVYRLFTL